MVQISNEWLTVEISETGAELMSIRGANGIEYLWQGDPAFWPYRAVNLFPYIGRTTPPGCIIDGKLYPMPMHGFLMTAETRLSAARTNWCTFRLESSEETEAVYPFQFSLDITFSLSGNRLCVTYLTENRSEKAMYYAIGGHPGFRVPLDDNIRFEDYGLSFDADIRPQQVVLTAEGFVSGETAELPLEPGNLLRLRHSLFDRDAVVLQNSGSRVTICSPKSEHGICMEYGDFKYLGLWQTAGKQAPFLCLEPWSALPSQGKAVEDLSRKADMERLAIGERKEHSWTATFF